MEFLIPHSEFREESGVSGGEKTGDPIARMPNETFIGARASRP